MNQHSTPSILGRLRAITPTSGNLSFDEALSVAELQATRMVALVGGIDQLSEVTIDGFPRIRVVHEPIAVSGMSHWTGVNWLITLNETDSPRRQRFTLLHEFKHIIDHGATHRLYTGNVRADAALQAERAADFFAGCALVPKRELKSAWGSGIQRIALLAEHFDVSEDAIVVRLAQTKLNQAVDHVPAARCARPVGSPSYGAQRFRVAHRPFRRSYS